MCPTQWLTPMMGMRHIWLSMRATTAQDTRGPPMPGPWVQGGDQAWGSERISTHPRLLNSGSQLASGAAPAHLGERDAADVHGRQLGVCQCLLHQAHRPLLVVDGGLPGQETLAWRRYEPAPGGRLGVGGGGSGGQWAAARRRLSRPAHVCRGLLRISPSSRTMPTPILLALPSMPRQCSISSAVGEPAVAGTKPNPAHRMAGGGGRLTRSIAHRRPPAAMWRRHGCRAR